MARPDALVITRAMTASTIAEVFVEDDHVRLELEIGVADLGAFTNLLPDELYERMGQDPEPFARRLPRFFREDFLIRPEGGAPLVGRIEEMEARPRVQRDDVTGAPLPVADEENAEFVVFARIRYPLKGRPSWMSVGLPASKAGPAASIGFVLYHRGLPVNDFRYLGREETVRFDWDDPWFSRFDNRNLRRQYDVPISAYLYVEPYEVRKEIVAGAPAYSWTVELGARNTLINQSMFPDANDLSVAVITPKAQELIGNAVMAKCDALDGLEDNIINDPTVCDFDVASLSCTNRESNECLTNEQVRAAETVYGDVVVNGERLWPGYPVGAEAYPGGWARWLTGGVSLGDVGEFQEGVAADSPFPEPETPNAHWAFGNGVMKYLVFNDPDWDYTTYDFEDFDAVTAAVAQTLNATSPDLDSFRARGGKLLLHNSWGDMALTAYGTIEYYESVIERAPDASDDVRLFLMPGVEHCFGGPGPSYVDVLDAIDNWVETGSAPDALTAVWLNEQFQPDGGRPVCAYPDVVTYDGQGDPRDPASFSCDVPQ